MRLFFEKVRDSSGNLIDILPITGDVVAIAPCPGGYEWGQIDPTTGQVLAAFKSSDVLLIEIPDTGGATGASVCKCPIKNLTSGGHDPGCPAKKKS